MITLGIETSCDETAASIVENGNVLSNEISSSVHLHAEYGGVVPEIASRFHTEYIYSVLEKALQDAGKTLEEVNLVSVTKGPGLPGSLLVGVAFAKAISLARNIPIIGVNHLSAHVLSCFLDKKGALNREIKFPFIGVVISGGHTSIYLCRDIENFECIGRTKDDAVGEAFDKVAKIMDLGYPGGPVVEKRAGEFNGKDEISFPRALLEDKEDLDFSFSGIKTAVLYYWQKCSKTEDEKNKICYSFQEAVTDVIVKKVIRAVRQNNIGILAVGGGVVNNHWLRTRLGEECQKLGIELKIPEKNNCTDNAAMIAVLGEILYKSGKRDDLYLSAEPTNNRL